MATVDGHEWAEKRIRFLESLLEQDPSEAQRTAIETELTDLRASAKRGWMRWLWPGRLPHEH